MSENQLERAYQLIKEGREQDAFDILEPLIAENPDNADAWWLLANATDDLPSKERALEQVLRIGANPAREEKARDMLDALNDMQSESDTPEPAFRSEPQKADASERQMPRRKIVDRQGNKRERSGSSAGKLFLMVVGGLSLFTCAICFGVVALLTPIATDIIAEIDESGLDVAVQELVTGFREVPENYVDMGEIEPGETVRSEIVSADDRIGYTYEASAGDRIRVEIRALSGNVAPPVFVYNPDGLLFEDTEGGIESKNSFSGEAISTLVTTLTQDGEYMLIVRPVFGFGQNEYEMTLEVLD